MVTEVGARRGAGASWLSPYADGELTEAVGDNLRNFGLETPGIVNLECAPAGGQIG